MRDTNNAKKCCIEDEMIIHDTDTVFFDPDVDDVISWHISNNDVYLLPSKLGGEPVAKSVTESAMKDLDVMKDFVGVTRHHLSLRDWLEWHGLKKHHADAIIDATDAETVDDLMLVCETAEETQVVIGRSGLGTRPAKTLKNAVEMRQKWQK